MKNPVTMLKTKLGAIAGDYRKLSGYGDYMRFLAGLCISRFGDGIDTIAFSMLIYQVTGSTLMVATLYAVNGLPNILFGLLSGAVTSHKQEKNIMAFCDAGRGMLALLTVTLCITGLIRPWHFYVITFLNSSFESFRSPASTSILPKLLPKESIGEGIALQTTASRLFDMLGLAAVPVLLLFMNLEGALFVNAITFFGCGLLTFTIRSAVPAEKKEKKANYLQDIADGLGYLKRQKALLNIVFFACFANVLYIPFQVFQVPFVDNYLQGRVVVLSVMNMLLSGGMIGFTVVAPSMSKKYAEEKLFLFFGLVIAASYLILFGASFVGASDVLSILLPAAAALCIGAAVSVINFIVMMKFYRMVEQEYTGRVISIIMMFSLCMMPLGSSLMGVLLEVIVIPQLYLWSAVGCVAVFGVNYLLSGGKQ